MSSSWEGSTEPAWIVLIVINVLDIIFSSCLNCPQWRTYMPFGLGDKDTNGLLSFELPPPISNILPQFLSYSEYSQMQQQQQRQQGIADKLSTMYKFAFETSSTTLGNLTSKDAIIVLFVLVLFIRKFKQICNPKFSELGTYLGRQTHGSEWVAKNQEKITKFGEYVFRLIVHSLLSIYGIVKFYNEPWWDFFLRDRDSKGTELFWSGYPHHAMSSSLIWYYLFQCAYNVDALISLVELSVEIQFQNPFTKNDDKNDDKNIILNLPLFKLSWKKTVRGDFREMMIHHIITNCLIFGSSYFRLTRAGSMVFMIHDISDVPIDLSKLANFVKWTKTSIFCFISMVIIWVVTRMTILPFVIVKSVWYESPLLYKDSATGSTHQLLDYVYYKIYFPFFCALMVGITLLHYFWFTMFIKIARDLTRGKVHDHSEHKNGPVDEDEDTVTDSKKKK